MNTSTKNHPSFFIDLFNVHSDYLILHARASIIAKPCQNDVWWLWLTPAHYIVKTHYVSGLNISNAVSLNQLLRWTVFTSSHRSFLPIKMIWRYIWLKTLNSYLNVSVMLVYSLIEPCHNLSRNVFVMLHKFVTSTAMLNLGKNHNEKYCFYFHRLVLRFENFTNNRAIN